MAYDLKITVFNNRDYEQGFTLQTAVGGVRNLTGCKLIFGIADTAKTLQSHDSSLTASNKCIFVTDAPNGGIKLTLPYSVLKTLPAATYKHDLILVDADGKRTGIWAGQMVVKKGVA